MAAEPHNEQLSVGLGIDVGGTFSDSVLIDLSTGKVLSKAKSPTTHADLVKGIESSVGLLNTKLFSHIHLVSLSTTLATNALVEGRKSQIAAILAGYKTSLCPQEFMEDSHLVRGGHTAEGDEMAPLDLDEVRRIIESTRDTVEAYAISSYFSTRNPSHELAIRGLVQRLAPQIPTTCGHELSHKLNARLRATTTILNAHLIPIIRDLLHSVRKVLDGFSIQAPLMVVKGDGSLFREEVCLSRPVETILSGPAASVVGASSLLGHLKDEAVVIDIGGTTSDVAILQGGYPKLNRNGVAVGPWQTHVTAVDVRTVGLGGDSHVRKNHNGEILIGARRVEPLCFLAKRFPGVIHQMRSLDSQPVNDARFTPIAFWFRTDKVKPPHLSDRVEKILKALSEGPLNIFEMAKELDEYPIALRDELTDLEHQGMLRMAGFTPTDIFHIRNLYDPGVRECSLMAAQFLAKQMGMDMEILLLKIDEIFHRKIALECLEKLSNHPVSYSTLEKDCPACEQIWENCFWERGDEAKHAKLGLFRIRLSLDTPIVGIGAPAHILVPPLAKRMEAKWSIPEHAEVANAIGAIVGAILINEQVLIRPLSESGYVCFTSKGKFVSPTIEGAMKKAHGFLKDHLRDEVRRAGGNGIEIDVWDNKKEVVLASGEKFLIEVLVHGQAVAKPKFQSKSRDLH
jgi:N-methylhydantoinase A/oxoprolinase/acetone carboxylase beta subunit